MMDPRKIIHFLVLVLSALKSFCNSLGARPPPHYFDFNKELGIFEEKSLELPASAPSLHHNFMHNKSMPFRYFSQDGPVQDRIISQILQNKTNGYFIDLASNDWKILSNSLMFEYFYDWKGICLEPNPG